MDYTVTLPSKPRIVKEEGNAGIYEIDGLFPGYGHTLGNSLRRIILSSLPGVAVTSLSIDGVQHEFSTLDGVKEDVVTMLLHIKKVRFLIHGEGPQQVSLLVKGPKKVQASDISTPSQVEVLTPEQHIADITDKRELSVTMTLEKGLGYVPREMHTTERMDIGSIALDALFAPIRRVNYEVENMRVGDRTDYNRLRMVIETDGTLTPRQALEESVSIMMQQLKAIVGFKEAVQEEVSDEVSGALTEPEILEAPQVERNEPDAEVLKTRIETLELSTRTLGALEGANIRTIGGLARKREEDILALEGIGMKGLQEIKRALAEHGVTLK